MKHKTRLQFIFNEQRVPVELLKERLVADLGNWCLWWKAGKGKMSNKQAGAQQGFVKVDGHRLLIDRVMYAIVMGEYPKPAASSNYIKMRLSILPEHTKQELFFEQRKGLLIDPQPEAVSQELEPVVTPAVDQDLVQEYERTEAKPVIEHDQVNSPSHYQIMPGVEVFDVRLALMQHMDEIGTPAAQIDCWSRAFEYLARMWRKGGIEDAEKAKWYLLKLIELMKAEQGEAA